MVFLTKWLIQTLHGFKYLVSTNQIDILKKNVEKSISVLTLAQIKAGVASAYQAVLSLLPLYLLW